MTTFVARMTAKVEKEADFIRFMTQLTEQTLANEPGCRTYRFFRIVGEERGFAVLEAYDDETAEEAHRNAEHFKELVPAILECLEGTYAREDLEPLA